MTIDELGKFPVEGKTARRDSKFYRVTREQMLHVIHGEKYPIPLTFFISNDFGHMGEFIIPAGGGSRASEVEVHNGDAVIYVESGPITFFLPESRETFEVLEGEAMFLPEGTPYQCINYTSKTVKGIFMVAPGL